MWLLCWKLCTRSTPSLLQIRASPGAARLICSLPVRSRKSLAHVGIDTRTTHASIAYDLKNTNYLTQSGSALGGVFATFKCWFKKQQHSKWTISGLKDCCESYLILFLLIGPMMVVCLGSFFSWKRHREGKGLPGKHGIFASHGIGYSWSWLLKTVERTQFSWTDLSQNCSIITLRLVMEFRLCSHSEKWKHSTTWWCKCQALEKIFFTWTWVERLMANLCISFIVFTFTDESILPHLIIANIYLLLQLNAGHY